MRRLTALVAAWLIVLGLGIGSGGAASAQGLADVRLGNEAFRQGDYSAAVRHYTDAIRSGELVGEALAITYNNRGVAHGEAGEFDPAIADYSQAMALRPGDATTVRNLRVAHVRRGELHFASGTYDDAVADFSRAIELEPEHHLAYQRRGELYTELGLIDLAVDDLEQAMLLSPGDAEITTALERATAQRERLAAAPGPGETTPDDATPGESTVADSEAADPGAAAPGPAAPEQPTVAETPTDALPSEAPSETPSETAEAPADAPIVAAVPTPAPRAPQGEAQGAAEPTPAEPEPSAASAPTAERAIDMAPAAPPAPAAPEATAEAVPEPAPAPVPTPAPTTAPTSPAAETTTAAVDGQPYRVVSAVNYRAGPDNDAQRLGTVDAGRIVQVTGDTLGWKHVILPNGDRGFIYGSWLEPAGN